MGQKSRPLQYPDGLQLLLGGLHNFIQIGAVAVQAPVDAVSEILLQLCAHDGHGRHRRADEGQEILNVLALLEVGDVAAAPGDALGGEAALFQQCRHLPIHLGVGGHEL